LPQFDVPLAVIPFASTQPAFFVLGANTREVWNCKFYSSVRRGRNIKEYPWPPFYQNYQFFVYDSARMYFTLLEALGFQLDYEWWISVLGYYYTELYNWGWMGFEFVSEWFGNSSAGAVSITVTVTKVIIKLREKHIELYIVGFLINGLFQIIKTILLTIFTLDIECSSTTYTMAV